MSVRASVDASTRIRSCNFIHQRGSGMGKRLAGGYSRYCMVTSTLFHPRSPQRSQLSTRLPTNELWKEAIAE